MPAKLGNFYQVLTSENGYFQVVDLVFKMTYTPVSEAAR